MNLGFPGNSEVKNLQASAGGSGSIPGPGTGLYMLQLGVRMPQLQLPQAAMKILSAATNT